ncbi:TatD family hydrolase [Acinetobacter chinensis]|uniref:TatD family hydrolase n=1 Tax=Acinetobacter chinensis TaxID=2004650 RepID=UPI0029347501|nr:TatD family hydrolase [Acinetobacter chinensis]WOE42053.1 TatD family hydrolase [Acinetobacter chinensis]
MKIQLFDTHTHFDVPDFDSDREQLAYAAKQVGVEKLILIGFLQQRFQDMLTTHHFLNGLNDAPQSLLAPGLHPFYIEQHSAEHLSSLEQLLQAEDCVAIGEIGLDTFLPEHKEPVVLKKQKDFFSAQLEMAEQYSKPVLLHIRKSHADVLALLKKHHFKNGGIAHAFSGGVEEAKAFIRAGFKIGVTGQITNPNARKLHTVVQAVGAEHLVLETDCPDMTPLCCQRSDQHRTRNTPANLPFVLDGLAQSLQIDREQLSYKLWENSHNVLNLKI